MTSRSTASLLVLLVLLAAPPGSSAGEAARTVAVADFSVRAPASRAEQSAWLGAAVAELLAAKMQLFRGARVLERARLALRQPADGAAESGGGGVPADLLRVTPASVLIVGSVQVAPDGEPVGIKVQARAVETETSLVISESAFAGTTDLAGLLQVAEGLARSLADALGLAYTPEQLAYAEPAGIDALKVYLQGTAQAAAGRHREAIEAYQRALEGNGGKYYPAAHRAQGEAYRALAASLGAGEAQRAREEYLAKFRADALVASGALFDLGQAYEANGLWREAIGAYDDYLTAVGKEGETVRWTFTPARDAGIRSAAVLFPAVPEGDQIHLLVKGDKGKPGIWWVRLDAETGSVRGCVSLLDALGLTEPEASQIRLIAGDRGGVYVFWHRIYGRDAQGNIAGNTSFGSPGVAALAPGGALLWKRSTGSESQRIVESLVDKGRLCLAVTSRTGPTEGLLLDTADGHTLDQFTFGKETFDLVTGSRVLPLSRSGGGRFFTPRQDGWLVLSGADGVQTAVNPDGGQPLSLYEGARLITAFQAQDDQYLLFSLMNDPSRGDIDPRYGVTTTERGTVLNLVSKSSRAIVAKHFLKNLQHVTLVGHDPVVVANNTVSRLRLVHGAQILVRPAAEAQLRRGSCLAEVGEDAAAAESLTRFETEFAGDPRSTFVRMRLAARRGDRTEAGRQGLRAMAAGGLAEEELRACLAAVRAVRPEVRDAIATPATSRLLLRSVAAPGVLVATLAGPREDNVHLVVDTVRRTSSVVPTAYPNRFMWSGLRYWQQRIYRLEFLDSWFSDGAELRYRISSIDLTTGARRQGAEFVGAYVAWLPGPGLWLGLTRNRQGLLERYDPEALEPVERLGIGNSESPPRFAGEVLVFGGDGARPHASGPQRVASFTVVDPVEGRVIGTATARLENERVAAVAADRSRLVVGINSPADHRVRLESFGLGSQGLDWEWRGAGRIAGNIVFEGGRLIFPLEEADANSPGAPPGGGPSIVKASLDLGTGEQWSVAPLPANPSAPAVLPRWARVRLFAGSAAWRVEAAEEDVYWAYAPDRMPFRVTGEGAENGCRVVLDDQDSAPTPKMFIQANVVPVIVCGETVYESVGGGVILVKDFAGARGLDRVVKDLAIGLAR